MSRIERTYYDETGAILQAIAAPDLETIQMNEPAAAGYVNGIFSPLKYRIVNGNAVSLPPKPADYMVFDPDEWEWIDPRTDDDFAREFEARRAAASIPKTAFIQSCMAAGILTPAEAATAARGGIPPSFEAAIANMGAEARDMVLIIWPSVTRIERMDPLILAVAAGAGISDETLDAIFGIV